MLFNTDHGEDIFGTYVKNNFVLDFFGMRFDRGKKIMSNQLKFWGGQPKYLCRDPKISSMQHTNLTKNDNISIWPHPCKMLIFLKNMQVSAFANIEVKNTTV